MTNLTLVASLAYKVAALQLLLPEASYVSEQLQLPTPHPIQMDDVQRCYVSSPKLLRPGVRIEVTNFVFTFPNGKLYVLENKIKHDERFDLYPEWAKTSSLINSNGAHQLATQWLAEIDVDVKTLKQKYPHQIEQAFYWNPPDTTNKTTLPIFNVTWGTNWPNEYPAQVRILGTTKELMELRLYESSLSRRPAIVITNAMELNNIPDPPLKRLGRPIEEPQTNSISHTNSPLQRPPPFRQQIKQKQTQ
jgi:hypothetical protein